MKKEKIINYGIYLLILLIPLQIYFNFYRNFSVSVAQIIAGILFIATIRKGFKVNLRNNIIKTELDKVIVIFIFVMFATILVSDNKTISVKYFIKWASFVLIYFISLINVREVETLRKYLKFAFFVCIFISIISILEYIIGITNILKWVANNKIASLIMEPETLNQKLNSGQLNWIIWYPDKIDLRVFGTFECVIDYSAYLGLMIPFSIWIFMVSNNKFYSICPILLLLCSLFLTYTRSAYISFILMVINLLFFAKELINIRNILIASTICILFVTSIIIINKSVKKSMRLDVQKPISEQFDRKQLWLNGIRIFKSKPFLGVGVANYQSGLTNYAGKNVNLLPAHNQYIQIAAEMGVIGLSAFLLIIFFGIKYSYIILSNSNNFEIRLIGLGFLGMWIWYCTQSIFSTHLFGDKFSMIFWLMVGLNASLYRIHMNIEKNELKV